MLQQATENGVIPVKLEDDMVRFRVGHLYANPASAVRELYANELRACHAARDRYGANPKIQITVNMPERTITIHGINSLGITEENFLNVLSVLGENDNQDGSEVGQFGWGISSYLSLSDSILIETFARETGEKFAMVGINGDHFSKVSQPTGLRETGTRVTVYVRDSMDIESLIQATRKICAYADIPTYLTLIREDEAERKYPGIFDSEQLNDEELGARFFDGEKIQVHDDHYELVGFLSRTWTDKPSHDVRLLRLPISAPGLKLPFDEAILNVKDEREFKPTADRERLRDDAVKKLQEEIDSKLKEVLPKFLDIASFDDFRQKKCKHIYYGAYCDYSHYPSGSLWRLYTPSETTKKLSRLLNLRIWVKGLSELRSPWVKRRIVNKLSRLGEVVETSDNIFLVDRLDKGLEELLRRRYPDATLIKLDDQSNPQIVQELIEQGVRTDALSEAEDIRNSFEPLPRSPSTKVEVDEDACEVVLHASSVREFEERGTTYRVLTEKSTTVKLSWTREGGVSDDTIFVPHIEKYLPILREVHACRRLSRLDKLPKQLRKGRTTLQQFIERHVGHEVATSKGKLTLHALLQEPDVTILVYEGQGIADHYDGEGLLVPLSAEEAFKLCLFLRAHDKPYTVWLVPPEAEFMRATGKSRSNYRYSEHFFNEDNNQRVNIVYHVGLAVKDTRMRRLFFAAATKADPIFELPRLRDFALSNFAKPAKQRGQEQLQFARIPSGKAP